MARPYRRLDSEWVKGLARQVGDGRTVTAVAKEAGVQQRVLARKLRSMRLVVPRKRSGPTGRLEYRATCSCGELITASQTGDNSDAAWLAWSRLARRHAVTAHGIAAALAIRWSHSLWSDSGERIVGPASMSNVDDA